LFNLNTTQHTLTTEYSQPTLGMRLFIDVQYCRVEEQMVNQWMDGWMDGCRAGWMDGWMQRWMDA
jgi:hypothetical protein